MEEKILNHATKNEITTQLETNTYSTKEISSTGQRIRVSISLIATIVPLITIIPLIFAIAKYRKKQKNSKTEKEKIENKKKKKTYIIIAIIMILLFCYGVFVKQIYTF